ncbi:unnamed protein product [Prunus armeniaca]
MAKEGLDFKYRKKFQGIEFRDMHDLINKVDRYASLLKEEVQKRTASKGTYYRNLVVSYAEADCPTEAESDEVEMSSAEVSIDKPFIPDAKFATRETKAYTFDLTRAEAIFDLLLTEKKVKLSFGHKIPKPEELKGKTLCKYHNSWSHNTNNCVVLRDVIQKLIDEKKLQFSEKTAMQVDCKPFLPPVINMVNAQLRAEYREVRRPAKGKESLAEPEPVPCSRCKYEIGQLRLPENKRKAAEPSQPTMKKFGGQYDRRPARRVVFDGLGARSPSTSAGHKDEAALRGSTEPLRQVQQARIQTAQVEGLKRQKKMATADEPPFSPIVPPTAKAASIKPPRTWRPRPDGYPCGMTAVSV